MAGELPGLQTELQPHQQRVVDRLAAPDQPGLLAIHGTGTGKSLGSIAAAQALELPAHAVVPASLQGNYAKELEKHLAPVAARPNIHSLQKVTMRPDTVPATDGFLIVDEAHRVRDPASRGHAALKQLGRNAAKRLYMTASPTYNHPVDLAPLVNLASGERLLPTAKTDFEDRYVKTRTIDPGLFARYIRGIQPGEVQELTRQQELENIAKKWIDYHQNAKDENFPERIDETIHVPMNEAQRDVYETVMGKAPSWVRYKIREGLPPSKQESADLNSFLTGARQAQLSPHVFQMGMDPLSGATKQRAAFERFQKALEANPEHKAVVYSNYLGAGLGPYQRMLEENEIPFGTFTGEMGKAERDQVVRDYNEGLLKALLISSAGGEGLDLKGTRQLQLLEPHFNEEKLKQVIGRGIRYQSHAHLPEDQRNVRVERYLSSQAPSRLDQLLGRTPPGTADAYLAQMSSNKERLNQQLHELLARAQASRDTPTPSTLPA